MTSSTPKLAAAEIATRLSSREIKIKHSQALELVAAGIGTDRHNLARMITLPTLVNVNTRLLTSAATVIARHDLERRATIIETTTAVLLNQPECSDATAEPSVHLAEGKIDIVITASELADPASFLASDRGQMIVDAVLEHQHYARWSRDGSSISDDKLASIANDAIGLQRLAKSADEHKFAAERAMVRHLRPNTTEEWWWYEGRSDWTSVSDALAEAVEEAGIEGFDAEEWSEAFEDIAIERLSAEDTSTPDCLLSSHDRVEIMFWLHGPDHSIDDLCEIAGPWPDAARVQINDQFQFALGKLGHTIGDWRKHVASKEASYLSGKRVSRKQAIATVNGEKRPLVSLDELKVIVDNGCTQFFGLVLYAWVPLADVLEMDMTRPVRITNPRVALYNPYAGTFMEAGTSPGAVVVQDGVDGEFTGLVGSSPRDICGMVMNRFEGRLECDAWARERDASDAAFKEHAARIGLRQAYPGLQIHWQRKVGTPTTLVAQVSFGDGSGRTEQQVVEARFTGDGPPAIVIQPKEARA